MHKHSAHPARARRPLAGLVCATLVLSSSVALSALAAGTASAAVLGTIDVAPASGDDQTLFGGTIANSQCPAGTGDSYFSIDGADLPPDQAILAPGNTTGTGAQMFSGASIANIKSANSGSFASSGAYTIRFNCVAESGITDTYQRVLNYVAGGNGAYTIQANTAPGAPTGVAATAGSASANVSWTAPASNGGSPITKYTVTATPAAGSPVSQDVASGTSTTVTGLTNGTQYAITVRAVNAIGTSAASSPAVNVTPAAVATAPGAPTGVTATAGAASANVAWTAPSNGGSAITKYTVTATPAAGAPVTKDVASGTSTTVTGLANGTSYTVTVTATNGVGTSPASSPVSVTPVAVPGAPTAVSATPGNTTAGISWTAPASSGGSAITKYTVTATPSSGSPVAQDVASGTSTTLTGLTNGIQYATRVTATNAQGTSAPSTPVNVTPAGPPSTPAAPTATAGNGQATVSFTAPASNGSAITSYTVTSAPGGFTSTGASSPRTVTGLTNGTSYTFTVTATNGQGTSGASPASNAVTPIAVPDAPTGVSATAGNTTADVSWTAPASSGGSAVTKYTVTATRASGTPVTKDVLSGTSTTLTGLTNGIQYAVRVTASNAQGAGPASSPVNVTPVGPPATPTAPIATAGNSQATVSFAAPASNGSAITSYTVTSTPGGFTSTGATSPRIVTGLTNGTSYTFTVTATNALGTSAASPSSNAVTPTEKTDTSVLLNQPPPHVLIGQRIRLHGSVSGVSGATNVTLRTYFHHGSTVDAIHSAPDGAFSLTFAPRRNATYRLMYLGDSTHNPSSSLTTRTIVHSAVYLGSVTVTGNRVAAAGRVAPAFAGQLVTLMDYRSGAVVLARTRADATGRFSVTVTLAPGAHALRVVAAATTQNGSGASVTRHVNIA